MGKEKAFPKRTSVLELVNEVLMHTVTFFFLNVCFNLFFFEFVSICLNLLNLFEFVSKFPGVDLRYRGLGKKNEWFLAAEGCS